LTKSIGRIKMEERERREGRESREGRDGGRQQERKRFVPGKMGKFIKKKCKFCKQKVDVIDYKDINLLRRFITPSAKILGSRVSGNCARHQALLSVAVKRARFLALLPYTIK
jgi:small subunit ribosomal protein S18